MIELRLEDGQRVTEHSALRAVAEVANTDAWLDDLQGVLEEIMTDCRRCVMGVPSPYGDETLSAMGAAWDRIQATLVDFRPRVCAKLESAGTTSPGWTIYRVAVRLISRDLPRQFLKSIQELSQLYVYINTIADDARGIAAFREKTSRAAARIERMRANVNDEDDEINSDIEEIRQQIVKWETSLAEKKRRVNEAAASVSEADEVSRKWLEALSAKLATCKSPMLRVFDPAAERMVKRLRRTRRTTAAVAILVILVVSTLAIKGWLEEAHRRERRVADLLTKFEPVEIKPKDVHAFRSSHYAELYIPKPLLERIRSFSIKSIKANLQDIRKDLDRALGDSTYDSTRDIMHPHAYKDGLWRMDQMIDIYTTSQREFELPDDYIRFGLSDKFRRRLKEYFGWVDVWLEYRTTREKIASDGSFFFVPKSICDGKRHLRFMFAPHLKGTEIVVRGELGGPAIATKCIVHEPSKDVGGPSGPVGT